MTEVFAHRGCRDGADENTLAAFAAARRVGAHGVELDVRRSGDGVLVVHHDARLASGQPVCDTPAAALPAGVVSLEEALEACAGLAVNVEIKNRPDEPGYSADGVLAASVAAAMSAAEAPARVFASSFDPGTVRAFRRATDDHPAALLLGFAADPRQAVQAAQAWGLQGIHPFVTLVDQALVDEVHRVGLVVHVWTVNAPEDLVSMGAMGVDAVITDRPAAALVALGDPGATPAPG